MKLRRISPALAVLLLAVTPAIAQKVDFARQGPAGPPVIDASEDYPLNYLGGEPSLFTAALDADDSTYNRAVSCTSLSGVGTAVAYDTLTITNNSAGTANFVVFSSMVGGGACAGAPDTFFTLYDTSFNPAAPLTNCLAVNDDISGSANRCSTLTFTIPLGQTRVVVLSAFDNASLPAGLFDYQVNFTGTTPVELVSFSGQ